jgi:hypothetical protein
LPRNPDNPARTIEDRAEDWQRLMQAEPYLAYRMMAVRLMVEHRGFSSADIAQAAGLRRKNRNYLNRAISPSKVNLSDVGEKNKNTPALQHKLLDDIEDIITRLTDASGGVYARCGCTTLAIQTLTSELAHVHDKEID